MIAICCLALLAETPAAQEDVRLDRSLRAKEGFHFAYPQGWSRVDRFQGLYELRRVDRQLLEQEPEKYKGSPQITVSVENRLSHEEALRRLKEIEAEENARAEYLAIGGWPALQRTFERRMERPGPQRAEGPDGDVALWVTTAIAYGRQLVRMQGFLPPNADPKLVEELEAVGLSFRFSQGLNKSQLESELEELRSTSPPSEGPGRLAFRETDRGQPGAGDEAFFDFDASQTSPGLARRINGGGGTDAEIEIAVSTDGRHIVIGNNGRDFITSNDGGKTFSAPAVVPGVPGGGANGDPSLAYGASGNFYFGYIGFPPGTPRQCSTGIALSTDNGQTFNFQANATQCNDNCFPDQEHIAADRFNLSATGQDQVYSTWRNFQGGGCGGSGTAIAGPEIPQLVCSSDSGANWSAAVNVGAMGDSYPRITVGQDGFVYVVYRAGSNNIMLNKFSSCDAGLTPQPGFPVAIASGINRVTCPAIPGLDRCNNGSDLTSHTVAVDDTNANRVFAAYAVSTDANVNENVLVRMSEDGGATWPASQVVQVNNGIPGRRFMPWVCAVGGEAFVSWYDMRNASGAQNDLADFFGGRAFRNALGDLEAGGEFRISTVSDALCASGWPAAPRNAQDSESCTVQPQLAGACTDTMGNATGARCDFSDCGGAGMGAGPNCQCNTGAGETCNLGRGVPKYGDYNGSACAAGRFYAAWASATSPPEITPASTDIDVFFEADLVCCEPQIQAPAAVNFGGTCLEGGEIRETLEICNTGKEDLEINSILSSDSDFSVAEPSSGFPVAVSPDFCFPFEVTFAPDSEGDDSATLTIASNDPVNPSVEVDATASVGSAAIDTFIADSGDFGEICVGDQKDLDLTVQNNGSCSLQIDSVSLSGSDASEFDLPDGSVSGAVVAPGNSLRIPVRFLPDNFSEGPRAANVDVASRTLEGASLTLDQTPVTGIAPAPDLNVAIANSGSFGAVCKGGQGDLELTLFNQGKCDLTITGVSSDNPAFVLPEDTSFPLVLSPDAQFSTFVRFQPQACSFTTIAGTITVDSDSPGEESLSIDVSGDSPCPNLVIDPPELSGDFAFPPTVVDAEGTLGCFSERSLSVRNTGGCPLTITGMSASGDDFAVQQPSQFPIVLPAGEETLGVSVRFTPVDSGDPLSPDEVLGTLAIDSDDPDAAGTAGLCGEGVAQSGVRILVTDVTSGDAVPVDSVDEIRISSKGRNNPSPINLRFTDQAPLSESVCGNLLTWHVNQETLPSAGTTGGNNKSSYLAKAKEGNLKAEQSFDLGQCDFQVFQLQLQDSGGESCPLLPKGASCSNDGECCSGKCRGPEGGKTCK